MELPVRSCIHHGSPQSYFTGVVRTTNAFSVLDTENDADLESCAKRKLCEKTSVEASLEQLGSWNRQPAFLMPREFTLTELQTTYEILLGRSVVKKSFRTRILATDLLDDVNRLNSAPIGRRNSTDCAIQYARYSSPEHSSHRHERGLGFNRQQMTRQDLRS